MDFFFLADGTNTGNAGEGNHEEHHAEHGHSIEEEIAHALHKASITILGILVAEVRHMQLYTL